MYGFLLVFCSNFVPVFEIFDFNNAVTLKTGQGSISNPPLIFCAPLKEFTLELGTGSGV